MIDVEQIQTDVAELLEGTGWVFAGVIDYGECARVYVRNDASGLVASAVVAEGWQALLAAEIAPVQEGA